MRKTLSTLFVGLIPLAAILGCPKTETTPVEDPAAAERKLQEEQEAARRSDAAEALSGRLSGIATTIGNLGGSAAGAVVPSSLAESVEGLKARLSEVEGLQSKLASASGDAWNAAKDRLEKALNELEQAASTASGAMNGWQERQRAALAERESAGVPIDPATGLLEGLDGGEYEPYKISVVEEVQGRLRALGLYAGPADGVFDVPLRAAVGTFQEQQELHVSGVPSPMTRERLFPG